VDWDNIGAVEPPALSSVAIEWPSGARTIAIKNCISD
jgi:hypothetical protein